MARVVERGVIGVDLGGTKLLAGAVDADLGVHHRTNRLIHGLDQDGLVQMVADAVEEILTAVGGGIEAVGFGIPCTFDVRTGMAVQAANAPLADIRFHEVMAERLGLPVVVDNDANCTVLCEARVGAAAGCSEVVLLTIGTGIGGGLLVGRRGLPRVDRRRGRDGAHGGRHGRPAVPVGLPEPRLPGDLLLGHDARASWPRWRWRGDPTPLWATPWRRGAS